MFSCYPRTYSFIFSYTLSVSPRRFVSRRLFHVLVAESPATNHFFFFLARCFVVPRQLHLDIIHQEGGGPLEPTDLPVETRHLDMYRTFAVELDKTWQCLGFGARPSTTRSRSPA